MVHIEHWLAKVAMYLILEIGALTGVPMRPDEIEKMTRVMNDSLVAECVRGERERSGDPPPEE